MGYYTKHIITIDDEHTPHDLARLANVIHKVSEYKFAVYPEIDCIDDRLWNSWFGAKWYDLPNEIKRISKEFGPVHFTVWCHGEDAEQYSFQCYDGAVVEIWYTETNPDGDYVKVCEFDDIDYDVSKGEYPREYDELYDVQCDNHGYYILDGDVPLKKQ